MIRTLLATFALGILVGLVGREIGYIATIMTLMCFTLLCGQFWKGLATWLSPKVEEKAE